MTKAKHVVIGSRGSMLALCQAQQVMERLQRLQPHRQFRLKLITTKGDRLSNLPLTRFGGTGVFIKELENALLAGDIDLAVHSLKDLPSEMRPGLTLAAVGEREDPRDALISQRNLSLANLPKGARLGTGSPRRAAQLRAFRSDFEICHLRGNIDTRLRKAQSGEFDGVVLAAAGLLRLGLHGQITEYIPLEVCLPAVGQGALGIEVRAGDDEMVELASFVDHLPTRQAVVAERAFLHSLGGGCQVPIACLGRALASTLELEGLVASEDGVRLVRAKATGDLTSPEVVGEQLAQRIMDLGGKDILGRG